VKGTKIAKKRQLKARTAGIKMGVTKRARPGSSRLKGVQLKTTGTQRVGTKLKRKKPRFQKSKIIK